MNRITPFLWFDGTAEPAARFYAETFPDSRVDAVNRSAADTPSGPAGSVLTVDFTVLGQPVIGLNGGAGHPHTPAFSFMVTTETQEETDRYWNAITSDGGSEIACGWCRDRFGIHWQITPRALLEAIRDPDREAARRAMQAMMSMRRIVIADIETARRGEAKG